MTKLSRFLLVLLLVFNYSFASAGSTTGLVTKYFTFEYPGTPPLLFVHIGGTATNPAACGTSTANGNRWVVRTDTPTGKAHMLAILMAKAMGQSVSITGKDGYFAPCDVWSDTESIQSVSVGG